MTRPIDIMTASEKQHYIKADQLNPEGFPSFTRSLEEQYLLTLLLNVMGHTFYASANTNYENSLDLHEQVMSSDVVYGSKAIMYARNEGFMRLQPIVGLVFLSRYNTQLFKEVFPHIIRTPGDLQDFVEIARNAGIRKGLGRALKTAINKWLCGMSEYHALKYAGGGQGYSLRDILRLTKPKTKDAKQGAIFAWLAKGVIVDAQLTPQIAAFEALKAGDIKAQQAITEAKLPHEIVTGVGGLSADEWRALSHEMPYFALLRHLVTLQRHKGLDVDYVAGRLGDPKAVKNAKVLPFRLYSAFKKFDVQSTAERKIQQALEAALENSEIPEIAGDVAIALDVSGSMHGRAIHGDMNCIEIGALFTGALLKQNRNALLMPFTTEVFPHKISGASILDTLQQLVNFPPGGTSLSAPISKLLRDGVRVDHFIGITDSEEWAHDAYGGLGFLPQWREYRKRINPEAKAWLVQLEPYGHSVAPSEEPNVSYIYGWNDSVLRFIGSDWDAQVKYIHKSSLDDYASKR